MKLGLTEKQYKDLLTLVAEQADAPAAEPEAGTSDKQAGGQGYPEVGKWESGVTRGPANQIGVTKWADVVGAKLTRGKANMLKEQPDEKFGTPKGLVKVPDTKYTDNFDKLISPTSEFYVPKGTKVLSKYIGTHLKMDNWEKDKQLIKWLPKNPTDPMSWKVLFPYIGSAVYSFKTLDNTIYTGNIVNTILEEYRGKDLSEFYKLTPDPTKWSFAGYYDDNGKKFDLGYWKNVGIFWSETWEEHSTEILLMIGSIIAGILTGGLADIGLLGVAAETGTMTAVEGLTYKAFYTYVAEGLVWSGGGLYEISQGKKLSGVMDIVFATLLPIIHFKWSVFTGLSEFTEKEMTDLSKLFQGKTSDELEIVFNSLTNRQKEIFRRIQLVPKNEWEKSVKLLYEKSSIKIEKLGLEPSEKLEETYLKCGNFIQKKWYLNLPSTLVKDFQFLGLIQEIFKKFKVEDTPKGDEAVKLTKKTYLTSTNKKETIKKTIEIIKQSKNIDEVIIKERETLSNKFKSIDYDTTGTQSYLDSLIKKHQQK